MSEQVALVLAGGGARGAYEIGVLSTLMPVLERRGERPTIVVGTSVGALNTAFIAANAHRPAQDVAADGRRIWTSIEWEQVLEPLASAGSLGRLATYAAEFLGVRRARVHSLLDPEPLERTLAELVDFAQMEDNVAVGDIRAAAVVATSALTSRSVVFHRGGDPPDSDPLRGIDYVEAPLKEQHVRASAAIPGVFPAVHVDAPHRASGWYYDGGTRLNTPIKPALALGADRVVVVALNSIAQPPPRLAGPEQPDALEGAAQLVQAVLVDPLVHDVRTLAETNRLVEAGAAGRRRIPYIVVAPRHRDTIGAIAAEVYREHYSGALETLRSTDVAVLGRALAGGSDPAHGELLSYLMFAPELAAALIKRGREDAERWLDAEHDEEIWQVEPLPPSA